MCPIKNSDSRYIDMLFCVSIRLRVGAHVMRELRASKRSGSGDVGLTCGDIVGFSRPNMPETGRESFPFGIDRARYGFRMGYGEAGDTESRLYRSSSISASSAAYFS